MSERLPELVAAVRKNAAYAHISLPLVERIAQEELNKGRSLKQAVKTTRSRLHQIGGAYQEKRIDYALALEQLPQLPADLVHSDTQAFCRGMLAQHASTRERLPHLENIFRESLAPIAPITSVLDLACGLNPLALHWMPLAEEFTYAACDIYEDQILFLRQFFAKMNVQGEAEVFDLVSLPDWISRPVQVVFILKTIACLEHLDKHIGRKLLEKINSQHVLVSFPAKSLGGRSKGMGRYYENHFHEIIDGLNWKVKRFEVQNELFFLLSR